VQTVEQKRCVPEWDFTWANDKCSLGFFKKKENAKQKELWVGLGFT